MTTRTLSFKSAASDRRWDALQFSLILGLCFVPFLLSAAAARLDRRFGRKIDVARLRGSILSEAWDASKIAAKTAFDG